jgi:hypothetical protein
MRFIRKNGHVIPIKETAVATGAIAAGAAASELSRRRTVVNTAEYAIKERKHFLSNRTTLNFKLKGVGPFIGHVTFRPIGRKLHVEEAMGIVPRANAMLLRETLRHAKKGGYRSITGDMANPNFTASLAKRGAVLVSRSKSGIKRIGVTAAKAGITRLSNGTATQVVSAILRLKKVV